MKVKELIEKLQQADPELSVFVEYDGGQRPVNGIEIGDFDHWHDGVSLGKTSGVVL